MNGVGVDGFPFACSASPFNCTNQQLELRFTARPLRKKNKLRGIIHVLCLHMSVHKDSCFLN